MRRCTSGRSRPGALDSLIPLLRRDPRIILAALARPFALRDSVEVLQAVLKIHAQALDFGDEVVYPGVSGERLICHAGIVRDAVPGRIPRLEPLLSAGPP